MAGAISDASTLIHLAMIGRLNLLKDFYGTVQIPPAVWREVVDQGRGRPGAEEVAEGMDGGWLKVIEPSDGALVRLLRRELDDGEAEAVALALEHQPDVLLLDESEARRVAEVYGLTKSGVVGLLIRAKREGELESLRDELDRLRDQGRFWLADSLYHWALQAVGEA